MWSTASELGLSACFPFYCFYIFFSHFHFVYISISCIFILIFKGFILEAQSLLRCKAFPENAFYSDTHCLHITLLIFKICQPQNKRILCYGNQQTSGWHINDNRWRNGEYRFMNKRREIPYLQVKQPIGVMGSQSLALLDSGSRWFSNKERKSMNSRVCFVSFHHAETPWGSIKQP